MLVVLGKVRKGMQGHIACFFVTECVYAPHIVMLVVLGKVRKGKQGHIACFSLLILLGHSFIIPLCCH